MLDTPRFDTPCRLRYAAVSFFQRCRYFAYVAILHSCRRCHAATRCRAFCLRCHARCCFAIFTLPDAASEGAPLLLRAAPLLSLIFATLAARRATPLIFAATPAFYAILRIRCRDADARYY